jgi:hypothetical protein
MDLAEMLTENVALMTPEVDTDAWVEVLDKTTPEEEEWHWEMPDLSKGSPWYLERVASLQEAVADLPDGDLHLVNGLEALQIHRENYSDQGPQRLQLLWWEFPSAHWKALREGC